MYVCMYVCNKNPLFTSINSIPEKKHKTFSKELRKKKKVIATCYHASVFGACDYRGTSHRDKNEKGMKSFCLTQDLRYFSTVSEHLLRRRRRLCDEPYC